LLRRGRESAQEAFRTTSGNGRGKRTNSAIKTYELEAIDKWHASKRTERREPELSMPTKLNMHDEVTDWWGTGMGTGWKA
jgi:hypothetical protein